MEEPMESMGTEIYLARWKDGTFTFFFDQDQKTLLHALDTIGDPANAEVRAVPAELMHAVSFDQAEKGQEVFAVDTDVESLIWRKCKRQVWPLEALGS
jgi:hypothetical protein